MKGSYGGRKKNKRKGGNERKRKEEKKRLKVGMSRSLGAFSFT